MQLLHNGGLTTYVFKSVQEDEYIVKVRASLDRLMMQADMIGGCKFQGAGERLVGWLSARVCSCMQRRA